MNILPPKRERDRRDRAEEKREKLAKADERGRNMEYANDYARGTQTVHEEKPLPLNNRKE